MVGREYLLFTTRLTERYNSLTKAEKRVADYMTDHLEEIASESIKSIAEKSGTGQATVMRFCRDCGFDGLLELKMSLKREDLDVESMRELNVQRGDSVSVVKQKVLASHVAVVESLRNSWNEEELGRAVAALEHAGDIMVIGYGDARSTAHLFREYCAQLDLECRMEVDPIDETYHLSRMREGDVVLAVCYSGRNRNVLESVRIAKERGVTTIGIVGINGSMLQKYLDITLISTQAQAEKRFSSLGRRIGERLVIDILYAALLTRVNVSQEQHENLHQLISRQRISENP